LKFIIIKNVVYDNSYEDASSLRIPGSIYYLPIWMFYTFLNRLHFLSRFLPKNCYLLLFHTFFQIVVWL